MRRQYKSIVGILLLLSMTLTGCSQSLWDVPSMIGENYRQKDPETMEVTYEVPEIKPSIFVNLMGYDAAYEKKAVLSAEVLPEEVSLIGPDGEISTITVSDHREETGKDLAYVDFSDIKKPGEYYIKAGSLGESYHFEIKGSLYKERVIELCTGCESLCPEAAYVMLEIYELFPEICGDDWGLPYSNNDIPDIIEIVGKYIGRTTGENGPEWAALLAKYAYLYSEYETGLNSESANKAKSAVTRVENLGESNQWYGALHAENYRLSGKAEEGSVLTKYYGELVEKPEEFNICDFYGALALMSTQNEVNLKVCGQIMKKLTRMSEDILREYKESILQNEPDEAMLDETMKDCMILSTVNHILPAYEYGKVIDRQYNIICGMNSSHIKVDTSNSLKAAGMAYIMAQMATTDINVQDIYENEN